MLLQQILLSAPLFILVFVGYGVMKFAGWPKSMSDSLSRFVFTLALPALLLHLMSDLSKLPPVDPRLLLAFFGACLLVFVLGRLLAWKVFRLDGAGQSVFAMGGIFSNNVMLGIPLTKTLLGDSALPSVALILVFNALILWTLITCSVEWARHSHMSVSALRKIVVDVLKNPIVASIMVGTLWGLTGWKLPAVLDSTLLLVASAAAPMALIALGMGLAEYGIGHDWRIPASIVVLKLILHPLLAFGLAYWLGLSPVATQAVVLMASISVGANVYLMARQFETMEGPVAASLVASTALAALTTPLALALTRLALPG
jgi:predicted permease